MATTDWTVRAEDDNTFCKTIDANLVSLQGGTAERNIALERKMAIYKRDSVKIGTFLLRLFESQLKIHLRMRVDTPKKWTDFKREVFCELSSKFPLLRHSRFRWTTDPWAKGQRTNAARELRETANEAVKQSMSKMPKHGSHFSTLHPFRQEVLRARESRSFGERVSILWNRAQGKRRLQEGQGRPECRHFQKRVGIVVRMGTCLLLSQEGPCGGRFDNNMPSWKPRSVHMEVASIIWQREWRNPSAQEMRRFVLLETQLCAKVRYLTSKSIRALKWVVLFGAFVLKRIHCMKPGSARVEVTTLWRVANCMSSVPGFWVWKLQLCEVMLWSCWCDSESWTLAKRFRRHKILAGLVERRASLLIAAMTILPGKFRALVKKARHLWRSCRWIEEACGLCSMHEAQAAVVQQRRPMTSCRVRQ